MLQIFFRQIMQVDAEAQKDADEFGFDKQGNFDPLKGMSEVLASSCQELLFLFATSCLSLLVCASVLAMHTCMHTCIMLTCTHTYIHTCIHTRLIPPPPTHTHAHKHTHKQERFDEVLEKSTCRTYQRCFKMELADDQVRASLNQTKCEPKPNKVPLPIQAHRCKSKSWSRAWFHPPSSTHPVQGQ
jgi:hypothetical protein